MAAERIYASGKTIHLPNGQEIPRGTVPVIDCTGWSEAKKKAYIIWDNRSSELATWDLEMLKVEMEDLRLSGFDIELTGFTESELDKMMPPVDPNEDKDPNAAPALQEKFISKVGDVWLLGPHRIMCGDSCKVDDWDKLMNKERADICWTDPPYNVDYGDKAEMLEKNDGGKRNTAKIKNDNMSDANFKQFLLDMYSCVFTVLKSGAAIYVAHSETERANFSELFLKAGFKMSGCIIWRKDSLVLGRSDYQWQHEPILYGWKPGSAHRWYGGRKLTTIQEYGDSGAISQRPDGKWQIKVGDSVLIVDGQAQIEQVLPSIINIDRPKRSDLHPTMKPVQLIEAQLRNNARPGDIVIDAFGGSGSTLMAADRLGMSARLMELDERYCDVIIRRWQEYSGRRAVHAETCQEFPKDDPIVS
jgi:DNA modification methylase